MPTKVGIHERFGVTNAFVGWPSFSVLTMYSTAEATSTPIGITPDRRRGPARLATAVRGWSRYVTNLAKLPLCKNSCIAKIPARAA
jgi:hypothetical protein